MDVGNLQERVKPILSIVSHFKISYQNASDWRPVDIYFASRKRKHESCWSSGKGRRGVCIPDRDAGAARAHRSSHEEG
jgi:hypothetical protein